MSLTSQLAEQSSPVRTWLRTSPYAHRLTFRASVLSTRSFQPVVVDPAVDRAMAGTAFDYAFRWEVGGLDPVTLVAYMGARILDRPGVVREIVAIGDADPGMRPACTIALTRYERLARDGIIPIEPVLARLPARAIVDQSQRLYGPTCDDVARLTAAIRPAFGNRLALPFRPNPTFIGSIYVGGADADWVLGRTLYECKVTGARQPLQEDHVIQAACYALLDWSDALDLDAVCVYLARHGILVDIPLSSLFKDLQAARASFREHLTR